MAKQHTINIGGKDRVLKYSFRAAKELNRAMNMQAGGKIVDAIDIIGNDSIDGWALLVCHGLRHEDMKLVPDTVIEWFEGVREEHREVYLDIVVPARRALGESGVLGRYFSFDEKGALIKDPEGKGDAAGV